jgi:RNA polymerase sigma factor (sigma-70 family)
MASHPLRSVLDNLRRSALLHEGAERTDSQLLEAFLRSRDPMALEALVRRHGPMVWGVCRRTLANHHEAEDAFQATFLVLLRKAVSIRSPELLPNWLYRVAYQTARKARQRAAQRGSRERQVGVMPEPPTELHDDTFGPELRALLDEELGRLPEKYRIAVVLCDVQGRTRHDAAQQLRVPEGTVASRLATGRALLAKRLLRRGFGVSATSLAAMGLHQAASGTVPAALLANTVKAVGLLAAGEAAAAGLISAEAHPLAEAVLRALALAKLKRAGAWLIVATLVLSGGLEAVHALTARPDQPPPAPQVAGEVPQFPAPVALREIRRFPVEEVAWGVSFSPDSRQVLIATGGLAPVRVCDVGSGKEVLRTSAYHSCWGAAYSPDGKTIAVGSGAQPVQILDALTARVREQVEFGARRVRNVAFSPDGRLIATSHGDGQLRLLDLARHQTPHAFRADNNAVHSAAFTPDGESLLVIDPDQTLRLYELCCGREVRRFEGHTARVIDVAVSPDGRHGLSCGGDATVRLWDLETGQELRCLKDPDGGLHGVAFCPDGRRALSAGATTIRLWDLVTGRETHCLVGHQGAVVCVAASPDGRYALSGSEDHTARLWRLPGPAPAPETP